MASTLAKQLVKLFKCSGIDAVFTIPGSLMHILDELCQTEGIRIFTSTHEEHLGYMAMGYQQVSGKIPLILVTQGPGLTNLLTPVSCAWRDRCPILLVTGFSSAPERAYFQDSSGRANSPNIVDIFKPVTRSQIKITPSNAENMLPVLASELRIMESPVLLELDQVMQELSPFPTIDNVVVSEKKQISLEHYLDSIPISSTSAIILGRGAYLLPRSELLGLLQTRDIPIFTTLGAKDLVPANIVGFSGHVGSMGCPSANDFLRTKCQEVIAIGASLNTQTLARWYTEFAKRSGVVYAINAEKPLIPGSYKHISVNLDKLDVPFYPLKIQKPEPSLNRVINKIEMATTEAVYSFEAFRPDIITNLKPRFDDKILMTASHGPLGCSLPMALGSWFAKPNQYHYVFCGDGGFLFTGMFHQTIVRYLPNIFMMVFVNREFKTVADSQRKKFGRTTCTDLNLPNFNYFEAYTGISTKFCFTNEDVEHALDEFHEAPKPTLVLIEECAENY